MNKTKPKTKTRKCKETFGADGNVYSLDRGDSTMTYAVSDIS